MTFLFPRCDMYPFPARYQMLFGNVFFPQFAPGHFSSHAWGHDPSWGQIFQMGWNHWLDYTGWNPKQTPKIEKENHLKHPPPWLWEPKMFIESKDFFQYSTSKWIHSFRFGFCAIGSVPGAPPPTSKIGPRKNWKIPHDWSLGHLGLSNPPSKVVFLFS